MPTGRVNEELCLIITMRKVVKIVGLVTAHEAEYVEGILPLTIPDINRGLSA